jgi:hypothetical protein
MINLTFIKKLTGEYSDLIKDNYLHIIVCSFVIFQIVIYFYVGYPHENKVTELNKKHNEIMLKEFKDLNYQMQIVAQNKSQKNVYEALQYIQKDADMLQKSILLVAKSTDIQNVSNQINSVREDVDNHINDLKKAMASTMGNKQFLDPETLPFHVISIDVIADQPYVTVDYDNHVLPIAVGDLLAGWRVSSAEYDSKIAEFMNEKNQFIRINLKGV